MSITEKTVEGRRRVRSDYEFDLITEVNLKSLMETFFGEINFIRANGSEVEYIDARQELKVWYNVDHDYNHQQKIVKVFAQVLKDGSDNGGVVDAFTFYLPWDEDDNTFTVPLARRDFLSNLDKLLKEIRGLYQSELGYI